jgi:hypothetical protein
MVYYGTLWFKNIITMPEIYEILGKNNINDDDNSSSNNNNNNISGNKNRIFNNVNPKACN